MAEEVDFEEEMIEAPKLAEKNEDAAVEAPRETGGRKSGGVKVKGRGHTNDGDNDDRYDGRGGVFERIEQSSGPGPLQCS